MNGKNPDPAAPASKLVPALVRPNNKYGDKKAGERVMVEPKELIRCAHALASPEQWAAEQAEAGKPQPSPAETQFRNFRRSARAGWQARLAAESALQRQKLEALGLTVTTEK
mgnify:CR=1 FL=1